MRRGSDTMGRRFVTGGLLLLAAVTAARAEVTVLVDRGTLDRVLAAATANEVEFPLTAERSLAMRLEEFRLLELRPGAAGETGHLVTAFRLQVPDLGLEVPLRPRMIPRVVDLDGRSLLELRFEEVLLTLPLAGPIDIARLIPPLRYPAENLWHLGGVRGAVPLRTRLSRVRVESEALRFEFRVDVERVD